MVTESIHYEVRIQSSSRRSYTYMAQRSPLIDCEISFLYLIDPFLEEMIPHTMRA
jgi:hypothetical protein